MLTTLRIFLMYFNKSFLSYHNIVFLKSLLSSTTSQVMVINIPQTDVETKVLSFNGTDEGDKYGNRLGTRIFDGKEENILFGILCSNVQK